MVRYRTKKQMLVYNPESEVIAKIPPDTQVNIEAFEQVDSREMRGFITEPTVGYCQMENTQIRNLLVPIQPNKEAPVILTETSRHNHSSISHSASLSYEPSKSISKSPLPPGVGCILNEYESSAKPKSLPSRHSRLDVVDSSSRRMDFVDLSCKRRPSHSAPTRTLKSCLEVKDESENHLSFSLEDDRRESKRMSHQLEEFRISKAYLQLEGDSSPPGAHSLLGKSALDSTTNESSSNKSVQNGSICGPPDISRSNTLPSRSSNPQVMVPADGRLMRSKTIRGDRKSQGIAKHYLQVGIKVSDGRSAGHACVAVHNDTTAEDVVQYIYKRRNLSLPISEYALAVTYTNSSLTDSNLLGPKLQPLRVQRNLSRKYTVDVLFDLIRKTAPKEKTHGTSTNCLIRPNETNVSGYLEWRLKLRNNWKRHFWVFNGAHGKGTMRGYYNKQRFEQRKKHNYMFKVDGSTGLLVLPQELFDEQTGVTQTEFFHFNIQTGQLTWRFKAKTFHDMGLWVKAFTRTTPNILNKRIELLDLGIQKTEAELSLQREELLEKYASLELFLQGNGDQATSYFMNFLKNKGIDYYMMCYLDVDNYAKTWEKADIATHDRFANEIVRTYVRNNSKLHISIPLTAQAKILQEFENGCPMDLFQPLQAFAKSRLEKEFDDFMDSPIFYKFINSRALRRINDRYPSSTFRRTISNPVSLQIKGCDLSPAPSPLPDPPPKPPP